MGKMCFTFVIAEALLYRAGQLSRELEIGFQKRPMIAKHTLLLHPLSQALWSFLIWIN